MEQSEINDLDKKSFHDSSILFSYFLKENKYLLNLIGVFTALAIYISRMIPSENESEIIAITYVSVFSIILLLFLIFIYNAINMISDHGGAGQPVTLPLLLFTILFSGLIAPLLASIIEFTDFLGVLVWYLFPLIGLSLAIWILNFVTSVDYSEHLLSDPKAIWLLNLVFILQYPLLQMLLLDSNEFFYIKPNQLNLTIAPLYYISLTFFVCGCIGIIVILYIKISDKKNK